MESKLSRRDLLGRTGVALGAGLALELAAPSRALAAPERTTAERTSAEPFGYCLNTSTIRGQELTIVQEVEIAAKAGYDAVEPWLGELTTFVKAGGSLRDLGKRIADLGLTVESAIGFAPWIIDDDAKRQQGLEDAKRDMDMVKQIGGKRIAAPPAGAIDVANLDLRKAAQRYRALLEIGESIGVVPEVELWGFSKCLNRLGDVAYMAIESGHPQACILPDIYHVYKGGSEFSGLKLLSGNAFHVLHTNDFPAQPTRDTIKDSNRLYPGDGVAPLTTLFRDLRDAGYRGVLSIELFNPDYWKQDALLVAKTALEKTKAVVRKALA